MAADAPLVWLYGYGFPLHREGPLEWADSVGLQYVVETLRAFGAEHGPQHWTLAPLLARPLSGGRRFYEDL